MPISATHKDPIFPPLSPPHIILTYLVVTPQRIILSDLRVVNPSKLICSVSLSLSILYYLILTFINSGGERAGDTICSDAEIFLK